MMTTTSSRLSGRSISHLQNIVKWVAVVVMIVDHVGAVLFPQELAFRVGGRIAFPAFVALIGYNVGARHVPIDKYLRRMVLFAGVSQVPFMLAGFDGLNIFATFALGLIGVALLRGEVPAWWGAALVLAPFVDYGIFGVLLVVVAVEICNRFRWWLVPVALVLLALAQGSLYWGVAALLVVSGAALAVMAVVAVGVPAVPRGPRWIFYAFYPAHLLLLVIIAAVVGA